MPQDRNPTSNQDPAIPVNSRSCARCGIIFPTFGREYVCPACRVNPPKLLTGQQRNRKLSNREKQIVDLVCAARTNKEIAYLLCLSEGTVKEYMFHIFRKTGVSNRTELALKYVQRG